MSEANKQFHIAVAYAGKNAYLASFYERLLNQGQRMLHISNIWSAPATAICSPTSTS
jgi:DNA-binding GntR family transcriptional regulator